MAVPTKPWQPIIYDGMLLANAVLELKRLGRVARHCDQFCEHQSYLVTALTRIRNLSQFLGGKKGDGLIVVTDPEFGGSADTSFFKGTFDVISKYVDHPHEQRHMKEEKYPRPNAETAQEAAKKMLPAVRGVLETIKGNFTGDAAKWYARFEKLYAAFMSA